MQAPKPETAFRYLSLDPEEFEQGVLDGLNDKLRDKIMASPEYKALTAPPPAPSKPKPTVKDDLDDEIPWTL
jgi:hypothetical protein